MLMEFCKHKYAKYIPIAGCAISAYFAYRYFSSGDTVQGCIEAIGAMVSLIPGGTIVKAGVKAAISGICDFVNLVWDFFNLTKN